MTKIGKKNNPSETGHLKTNKSMNRKTKYKEMIKNSFKKSNEESFSPFFKKNKVLKPASIEIINEYRIEISISRFFRSGN